MWGARRCRRNVSVLPILGLPWGVVCVVWGRRPFLLAFRARGVPNSRDFARLRKRTFWTSSLPIHQHPASEAKFLQVGKDQRMHFPNGLTGFRAPRARAPGPPSVKGTQTDIAQKAKRREGSKDAFAGRCSPAAWLSFVVSQTGVRGRARAARGSPDIRWERGIL